MKICFISPFPPEKEGTSDYSFYLIKSIEDVCSDCTIYIMARSLNDKPSVTSISERVTLLRIWKMKSLKDTLQSIITMIKAIIRMKTDILHIQYHFKRGLGGSVGEPFFILMFAVKKVIRKLKIIVSLHDFWLPLEAEQRVYEITSSRVVAKLYKFYYEAYVRLMLNVPDLVICIVNIKGCPIVELVKKYTRREVVEVIHGLPYDKGMGRCATTRCKEKFGVNNKFTILLFGFIRRAKGYDYIIKAVSKIVRSPSMKDKIRIILIGVPILPEDQAYLNYLRELIYKLDLRDIALIITKYLSTDEIDTVFGAADIAISSYTRRVGPSGVFSFALAYEVPSIVTCDDKYIAHGTNLPALLVNLNTDEIASAILKLMIDKNEYAKQIRRIKEYKAINSNQNIAMLHVQLYKKLCSDSPSSP